MPGGSITTAGNGTVVLQEDGSFVYTPNPSFHGVDTFSYKITDGYPAIGAPRDEPTDGLDDIAIIATNDAIYVGKLSEAQKVGAVVKTLRNGKDTKGLKRNGTIVRDGNKVALAERATANGAHLVAAHDVSSDTSVAANE